MTDRRDNAPPPDGWRPEPRGCELLRYLTNVIHDEPEVPPNVVLSDN